MAQNSETTPLRTRWSQHWRIPTRPIAAPSWIVSLALHATLLILVVTQFQSCRSGVAGVDEGEIREVGIYLKEESNRLENADLAADDSNEPIRQNEQDFFNASTKPNPQDDNSISDLIDLPIVESPRLGPGFLPPSTAASDIGKLLKPNRVGRSSAAFTLQEGTASFFNIEDKGRRFVYVLDRSGSMDRHGAIFVAKEELRASIATLDATQLFQIMFYSTTVAEMRVGRDKRKLYAATEVNRTMARQFINGIEPDGGTNHMPALRAAMKYDPEVIFFLTDADEPQLSAADLNDIRKLNRGRAKIHCIEFGNGPELSVDSFPKKLARQNEGMYRYRDVTRFRRR